MQTILEFVRGYFIFMLILFLFSYLVPKDAYKKYFQFFIGVLVAAILLRPVIRLFTDDSRQEVEKEIDMLREEIEQLEYLERGEDIYERFLKDSGVDTKEAGEAQ